MANHNAACESYLAGLLTAPEDSIEHAMGDYIEHIPDAEARDFVLTVIDEDPADSTAVAIAAHLWPLLTEGVQR